MMKKSCLHKLIPLLLASFIATGCVTVKEEEIHNRYEATYDSFYKPSDTSNITTSFDNNSTLSDYLKYAFAHNPKLRAAFNHWKAALEHIPQARSLEDPTLSFDYFIEQLDTRHKVSLQQVFPAFGKLTLRNNIAASEAQTAMHHFEADRTMLFDHTVKAFCEYYYLSRATAITDENHKLLTDLEAVVAAKYKAGATPFSGLIKVQVEKERIANELATLKDERESRSSTLAALLNMPTHTKVIPWPKISLSSQSYMDDDVLIDMIENLNPELREVESMITTWKYRKKLARKNFLPDFTIGASWITMPGQEDDEDVSDTSITAGISIPLWLGKYRAETREADAMINATINERDNMRNMLIAELKMAIFKSRDAQRRITLFKKSLIPKATQAMEVARQEFSTGKTDFMTLIDAQRTLLEFRLMAERATVDYEIAMAEIGCCIGKYDIGD